MLKQAEMLQLIIELGMADRRCENVAFLSVCLGVPVFHVQLVFAAELRLSFANERGQSVDRSLRLPHRWQES